MVFEMTITLTPASCAACSLGFDFYARCHVASLDECMQTFPWLFEVLGLTHVTPTVFDYLVKNCLHVYWFGNGRGIHAVNLQCRYVV
ncbi:hypothetical protein BO86DRAFT_250103 [Aspergillus japonicus CBS 114.51]|nr:hypothetical protein BO86DRAFT_250103 [Aspergillus japonicus CBS 114.51]RAH76524.1 hypothetical protein BO86DRAFT_250103 [Aspergillus japonicus CBS 114.51]